ncbi:N-acetyl-gamma-glutamyl-phosphate reductase [Aureibacillus halotolerans]|uniref:N-acetyl-gamma-glutamyl-phosphate reductase n=1 Tax=Aureibacillus halotolerans TaxID=1508390 RepID=A0A4R6UG38_9BACI|nr:N-acetyl-gamma-glutamyl-phosphate reductase [Aureibacillus halotolerans]TDQ42104.1 N-acetyl-gamma-glutamyl-phosphate reductase [Aureibacillus halotolerans]
MNVGIVGATGYGGAELIRLINHHPYATVSAVYSTTQDGAALSESYPHMLDMNSLVLQAFDAKHAGATCDVVFLATPPGVSSKLSPSLLAENVKVIDLSGDLRLKNPDDYEVWYKKKPADESLLSEAVYGLTEWTGEAVKKARLIANPGCYPTAVLLGLLPLLKAGLIEPDSLLIDAKSGTSGAGRSASAIAHFPEMNDNFKIYKVNQHQHTPEIEQMLSTVTDKLTPITFSTHLVPMTRGIMATMYGKLTVGTQAEDLRAAYEQSYHSAPFVRLRPEGQFPSTKEVYGSNFCDIGFTLDQRTNRVTIVSVIDNLVKGAAGQAIHNLNVLAGFEETAGLQMVPVYP